MQPRTSRKIAGDVVHAETRDAVSFNVSVCGITVSRNVNEWSADQMVEELRGAITRLLDDPNLEADRCKL